MVIHAAFVFTMSGPGLEIGVGGQIRLRGVAVGAFGVRGNLKLVSALLVGPGVESSSLWDLPLLTSSTIGFGSMIWVLSVIPRFRAGSCDSGGLHIVLPVSFWGLARGGSRRQGVVRIVTTAARKIETKPSLQNRGLKNAIPGFGNVEPIGITPRDHRRFARLLLLASV